MRTSRRHRRLDSEGRGGGGKRDRGGDTEGQEETQKERHRGSGGDTKGKTQKVRRRHRGTG